MAEKSWRLLDCRDQIDVGDIIVSPEDVGGPATGYRVEKLRLKGGLSDGVDRVRVDNGRLSFDVLPSRGMGLWRGAIDGQPLGWTSPVPGPVHPSFVPLADPSGLGWLDGFDEWLVRCGLESNGAPEFDELHRLQFGLHGRIANKPAHQLDLAVDGQTGDIRLRGVVDEVRFHLFKLRLHSTVKTTAGEPYLEIEDTIENRSASPATAQLLYHINFGPPLLGPGSRLVASARTVVPRNSRAVEGIDQWDQYAAPEPGSEEQVYFFQMQEGPDERTELLLTDAAGSRGVSVGYSTSQLPCFTLWKNTTAEADGYVTGLEPGTNFPNPHTFEREQGRVVHLPPGGTSTFQLRLEFHQSADRVERVASRIRSLATQTPTVHRSPQSAWCADS